MTSFELREHLDEMLAVISIDRVLPKYIFILARGYQQISQELIELLYTRNRTLFSKKQQFTQDKFFEIRKQSDTFPLGHIFHEGITLMETLRRVQGAFEEVEDRAVRELTAQAESFYEAAERYARSGSDESFAALLIEAGHLYPTLITFRHLFFTMRQMLAQDEEVDRGKAQLSLFFKHSRSFGAVVGKLASLERAFLELCRLTDVPDDARTLQVVKIETGGPDTGGLWVSVVGEARIIDVLGALIGRYALFLFRRLAAADPETLISDRVLANQSLVNLMDELERVGFRALLSDESTLQKTALMLRRDFVTLLAGEPSVQVNGEPFEVDQPAWPAYITESLRLLPKYNAVVHLNEQAG